MSQEGVSPERVSQEDLSGDEALSRLSGALAEIERAAAENVARGIEIQRRVEWLRRRIDDGVPIGQLVEAEHSPRVVELLTTNMAMLESVGAEFRASLALALRNDGLTIEAIAVLFGVTRQRISALLRQKAAREAPVPWAVGRPTGDRPGPPPRPSGTE